VDAEAFVYTIALGFNKSYRVASCHGAYTSVSHSNTTIVAVRVVLSWGLCLISQYVEQAHR
jgi:hypothetical protein